MKRIVTLTVCLILKTALFCQTKSGVFNYIDNKISFTDSFPIQSSFIRDVKLKLNKQAQKYNSSILYEANKMKNYIIFEDSSTLSSNVYFHTQQMLSDGIWQAQVDFKKSNSNIILFLHDIKRQKLQVMNMNIDNEFSIENADDKRQIKMMKMLNEQIKQFIVL